MLWCRITEISKSTSPIGGNSEGSRAPAKSNVEDPVKVKTKGNPGRSGNNIVKKPRHCGFCNNIGHMRTHCPRLGKSPKKKYLKRNSQVNEEFEENDTEISFVDTGEEEVEDQWVYSTMPSPLHKSRENLAGDDSDNAVNDSEVCVARLLKYITYMS